MAKRGKKAAGGKAKAGKKRPTTVRNLDVKRVAGGVKGGVGAVSAKHKDNIKVYSRR